MTALKKKNPRIYKQFMIRFQRITDGYQLDQKLPFEQYCSLQGHKPIDEIKVSIPKSPAYRCFCFREGNTYWLTHCKEKGKADQWYSQQATTALNIRNKHLEEHTRKGQGK